MLENAVSPEPLPDDTLLVTRFNSEGRSQLFRFWPDSGRLQAFPLVVANVGDWGVGIRSWRVVMRRLSWVPKSHLTSSLRPNPENISIS